MQQQTPSFTGAYLNQNTSPALTVDLQELALLILREGGFLHPDAREGAIIASGGQAWRYRDGQLHEVPWHAYETALNSSDRNDWPPYTIDFSIVPGTGCQSLELSVSTLYDRGICEESRGGNETRWTLQYAGNRWQTVTLEHLMSWD